MPDLKTFILEVNRELDPETFFQAIGFRPLKGVRPLARGKCVLATHTKEDGRSLAMNTVTHQWYCHRCNRGGDWVGLYALRFQLSNAKAAHELTRSSDGHQGRQDKQ